MLNEDSPIEELNKDTLNRSNFSENLALNIQNYLKGKDEKNCLKYQIISLL